VTGRAWLAFATVAVVWGIPYFLIKIAVGEVSPPVIAWSRLVLGAAILLPIAWQRGALRPAWERRWWVALIGVTYMAVPWLLIPLGETRISSSLAAIIVAAVPLTVTIISLRQERPHPLRLVGLLGGLAGVALMVGVDVAGQPAELIGAASLIAVTFCYAISSILIGRKLGGIDQIGTVALSLAAAAVVETVPAALTLPSRVPSATTLLSLVALGVLCSALAMVLFFFLITSAGPGRATVVTYINPLVAVALGIFVLGERFTVSTAIGGALVLGGSWLATRGPRPAAARATAAGDARTGSGARGTPASTTGR
jgi:drug/metabolite transporter (DMT)-like permease